MNTSKHINFGLLAANLLLTLLVILLLINGSVIARSIQAGSVPKVISYQGTLTDNEGVPLNSAVDLTISLFDVETGGTALFTESYENWPVKKGGFSILLGSQNPFPDTLFTNPDCWLELTVNGEILAPRQKFASVPYAINTQMLGGRDAASYALNSHTHPTTGAGEIWTEGDTHANGLEGAVQDIGGYGYSPSMSNGEFFNSFSDSFLPRDSAKKLKEIKVMLSRQGTYDGSFMMAFEIRDYDGNLVKTVSASPLDLQTAPTYTWYNVTLSSSESDLLIDPGHYLSIHVVRGGPQGGDLFIGASFYAEVE